MSGDSFFESKKFKTIMKVIKKVLERDSLRQTANKLMGESV